MSSTKLNILSPIIAIALSVVMLSTSAFAMFGEGTSPEDISYGLSAAYFVAANGNDSWSGRLDAPNEEGTDGPFLTLQKACLTAMAGDTVVIREGSYQHGVYPQNSGYEGAPITFTNYPGEKVNIGTGGFRSDPRDPSSTASSAYGVYMYDKEYIVIDGLRFEQPERMGRIVASNNITVKNCVFDGQGRIKTSGGTSHGLLFEACSHCVVEGNVITDAYDNLILVQSDHNLVEGNVITRAAHVLWCIRGGSYNFISGNYFHNGLQKIGEIYDNGSWGSWNGATSSGGVGSQPATYIGAPAVSGQSRFGTTSQDSARQNVVENNVFAYTPQGQELAQYGYVDAIETGGPGIQFAGQECIIRNNVFHNNQGAGVNMSNYLDEAYINRDNRLYNNTFVDNRSGGIGLPPRSTQSQALDGYPNMFFFYGNIMKNNILTGNTQEWTGHGNHFFTGWVEQWGKPIQVSNIRWDGFRMINNTIYSPDPAYAVSDGNGPYIYSNYTTHEKWSLSELQATGNYPFSNLFKRNIGDVKPEFVGYNAAFDDFVTDFSKTYTPKIPFAVKHDLTLQPGSALIGTGEWLTFTAPGQDQFAAGMGMNATGWYSVAGGAGGNQYSPNGNALSNVIAVQDPLYFTDGFGVTQGDWIITELGDVAQIVDMTYSLGFNKITLDRQIRERTVDSFQGQAIPGAPNWRGVGITLYYPEGAGAKSDMGVNMSRIDQQALEDLYNTLYWNDYDALFTVNELKNVVDSDRAAKMLGAITEPKLGLDLSGLMHLVEDVDVFTKSGNAVAYGEYIKAAIAAGAVNPADTHTELFVPRWSAEALVVAQAIIDGAPYADTTELQISLDDAVAIYVDLSALIETINNAKDADSMRAAIYGLTGLNLSAFEALSEEDQLLVLQALINNAPYNGLSAVRIALNAAINGIPQDSDVLNAVNNAANATDMEAALTEPELGLDVTNYLALSQEKRDDVSNAMAAGRPYLNIAVLQAVFNVNTATYTPGVNNRDNSTREANAQEMRPLIQSNTGSPPAQSHPALGLDMSSYNYANPNQSIYILHMLNVQKPYDGVADIQIALDTACKLDWAPNVGNVSPLAVINNARTTTEVRMAIDAIRSPMALDYTQYDQLTFAQKKRVAAALLDGGRPYADDAAVQTVLDNAIYEILNGEDNNDAYLDAVNNASTVSDMEEAILNAALNLNTAAYLRLTQTTRDDVSLAMIAGRPYNSTDILQAVLNVNTAENDASMITALRDPALGLEHLTAIYDGLETTPYWGNFITNDNQRTQIASALVGQKPYDGAAEIELAFLAAIELCNGGFVPTIYIIREATTTAQIRLALVNTRGPAPLGLDLSTYEYLAFVEKKLVANKLLESDRDYPFDGVRVHPLNETTEAARAAVQADLDMAIGALQ